VVIRFMVGDVCCKDVDNLFDKKDGKIFVWLC
jgi:hypothetical protein